MDPVQVVLGLSVFIGMKFFDLTDPEVIDNIHTLFLVSGSVSITVLAYIYLTITRSNDTTQIFVSDADLEQTSPLQQMLQPQQNSDVKTQVMTIAEYDMVKFKLLLKSTLTSLCISYLLFNWKGFIPPLLLQSVFPLYGICSSPLAKLHIWGTNDKQYVKRPWKKEETSLSAMFKDVKKEFQQTMAQQNGDAAKQRKNKKNENQLARKLAAKTS